MSSFWSIYIIVLVSLNIAACWWLLWACSRKQPGDPNSTTHVWDEDLTEYNKPLPRWWLGLFYGSVVFGVVYLVLYPGLGNFQGLLGWSQELTYEQQKIVLQTKQEQALAQYAAVEIPALATDPLAMQRASKLFAHHCAACHGTDGGGAKGFPNLGDQDWLYGGTPEAIEHSIAQGRQGMMPPLAAALGGETELQAMVTYVRQLGAQPQAAMVPAQTPELNLAKQKFAQFCAACHGAEGQGNPVFGAPNLTDSIWLYGGSEAAIKATLQQGRSGQMPAHKEILSAAEIHLLTAYVYSLGKL